MYAKHFVVCPEYHECSVYGLKEEKKNIPACVDSVFCTFTYPLGVLVSSGPLWNVRGIKDGSRPALSVGRI